MTCKLSVGQIAQRMQQRAYTGPIATNVGGTYNFTYATSDVVPQGKSWLVTGASVALNSSGGVESPNQVPELYLLRAGSPMPPNVGAYKQQAIFLSLVLGVPTPATVCNGLPVDPNYGVRVDDCIGDDVVQPGGQGTPQVVNMLRGRVPLLMGQGEALLAHNSGNNTGGVLHAILTLTIRFVEFDQRDSVDWF